MNLRQTTKRLIIGGALMVMPFLTFAATTTNNIRQQIKTERQADIQNKREDFKNKIQQRIDGLKTHYGEVRAKRIEQFFGNMTEKMDGAIDRLNKSADRINKYLDKLSAQGKEVSALHTELDFAITKIQDAQKTLDDAKIKFNAMTLSSDPKKSFKEVKVLILQVSQKIKDAHKALVEVVKSIKGSSGTATTTNSQ